MHTPQACCPGPPWNSAPQILVQCFLATLTGVRMALSKPWQCPCGANSAGLQKARAVEVVSLQPDFKACSKAWEPRERPVAGAEPLQKAPTRAMPE